MSRRTMLACCLVAFASCSATSDPDDPDPGDESIAGTYAATAFSVTVGGQVTDVLAIGGSLALALSANGANTGRLMVPNGGENGQTLDADLAGTWTRAGNVVHFTQGADTFVRDAAWSVVGTTLRTAFASGGVAVDVVLSRQ